MKIIGLLYQLESSVHSLINKIYNHSEFQIKSKWMPLTFTRGSKKWWKRHWQSSAGRGEQRHKRQANSFLCNCITRRREPGPSNINDKKPGVNRGGKKLLYSQPLWFRYKVRFVQGIEVNMGFSLSCACTCNWKRELFRGSEFECLC